MARPFWLSDEAWPPIDPHLPRGRPGKPRVDDRRVIDGILHVLNTGCQWRNAPPGYGPATTVYNRHNRRPQRGLWQRMFERVAASGDLPDELIFDSSRAEAHRSAAGEKGGVDAGGRALAQRPNCEIHRLADDRGRPVAFAPTPGDIAGIAMAVAAPKRLVAGGVYDVESSRGRLAARRVEAVIPSTAARAVPHPLDRRAYARRNSVERLFCCFESTRRIATGARPPRPQPPRRPRNRVGLVGPLPSGP